LYNQNSKSKFIGDQNMINELYTSQPEGASCKRV